MCILVLGQMVERKKGLILNVSSASAVLPTPLMTMYSSTKVNIVVHKKTWNVIFKTFDFRRTCTSLVKIWHWSMPRSVSRSNAFCLVSWYLKWVGTRNRLSEFLYLEISFVATWDHWVWNSLQLVFGSTKFWYLFFFFKFSFIFFSWC